MYNLNKKQKIILGILIAIVAGFICYYVYAKDNQDITTQELENNIQTNETETEEEFSDDTIFVHVSGAVNKEGLVELKTNSRISDAIEKAGGIREDANTDSINLAYKLEDGMKIHIPTKQEVEKQTNNEDSTQSHITTSSGVSTNQEQSQNQQTTQNTKVNINTASQEQLETLPGVGPATATKILTYRKENGKFKKIEDIKQVTGIGEAKFEKMKEYITVK